VLRYHHAALPLALAFGWAGIVLVRLAWPLLAPGSSLGGGDYLFLVILLNLFHYAVAAGIGVIWARLLAFGPDCAFAGGWRHAAELWRRALSRLGAVVLLGIVLTVPAVFAAAMAGHMFSLLLGGEMAGNLQLPLVVIALAPPALIATGTLWLSIAKQPVGEMPRFDIALKSVTAAWRPLFGLLLTAFGIAALLQLSVIALGGGKAPDPTTLFGMSVQFLASTGEMLVILAVIAAFTRCPLATPD